jgi:hypothetical protein
MSSSTPPPPPNQPPFGSHGHGSGQGWPLSGPKPPNHLVWAILTTLCCCLPFGIVSIVFAAQVDSKYNGGDLAGALQASENAKKWAIAAGVSGVAIVVVWSVLLAAGSASLG